MAASWLDIMRCARCMCEEHQNQPGHVGPPPPTVTVSVTEGLRPPIVAGAQYAAASGTHMPGVCACRNPCTVGWRWPGRGACVEHSVGAGTRRRAPCELRIVQTPGVQPCRHGGALCIVRPPGGDRSQRSGRRQFAGCPLLEGDRGALAAEVPRGSRGGQVVVGVGGWRGGFRRRAAAPWRRGRVLVGAGASIAAQRWGSSG